MPFLGTRGAGSNRAFGYAGAAKPNQVTGLTATDFGTSRAFNNGRIDLSWSTPGNNGSTISGYFIERSTNGSSYSTLVSNTGTTGTTYSDTGLTSSQQYWYRVSAINAAGTGDASTAASATATTVPQAPVVTAANVGTGRAFNNGAATITATGGATGGKAISSYTATSSPGSFTATSGSPLTVTGLQSATSYTFSVTATNANGTSTATTSDSITATTVPQAPTIGTATAGNNSATVTYTANATGGATVTTFTATSSPGSLTGTGASPITVSGLTNGTAYTFTVTATNINGTSSSSSASNSVTPVSPAGTAWITLTPTMSGEGAQYTQPYIYSVVSIGNGWQVGGATNNGYDMSAWGNGTSGNPPTSWTYTMGPFTNGGNGKVIATSNGYAFRFLQGSSNYYSYTTTPAQNASGWSSSGNILTSIGSPGMVRHDSSLGRYVRGFVYNGTSPWLETWASLNSGTSTTFDLSALSLPSGASWDVPTYFGTYYYFPTYFGTTQNYVYYRNGIATTGWSFVTMPSGYTRVEASNSFVCLFTNSSSSYLYSTDGVNFTSGTLPSAITSVGYTEPWQSNYVFIAAGGTVYYTRNGSTWTATNLPTSYLTNGMSYNSANAKWSAAPSFLANASFVTQPWYYRSN